jgi:hypothetical protein
VFLLVYHYPAEIAFAFKLSGLVVKTFFRDKGEDHEKYY